MKRTCIFFSAIAFALLFSCTMEADDTSESIVLNASSDGGVEITSDETSYSLADSTIHESDDTTQRQVYQEFVYNYTAYAERGAVIVSYDSQTGECIYKQKCEKCGWTSGPHNNYIKSGTLHGGFSCGNSKCDMWGQSQEYRIAAEDNGYWVDVYDD